jgi:hypothetical protein
MSINTSTLIKNLLTYGAYDSINPAMPEEPFCGLQMTKDCYVQRRAIIFHPLIFGATC